MKTIKIPTAVHKAITELDSQLLSPEITDSLSDAQIEILLSELDESVIKHIASGTAQVINAASDQIVHKAAHLSETLLCYLSVRAQLNGDHEQEELNDDLGDIFIF